MITQAKYLNQTNLNTTLASAIIEQNGDFESIAEYPSDYQDASAGISGFIYHHDTIKFSEDNLTLILEKLRDDAQEFGLDGAYSMIASFNCINDMTTDDVVDAIRDKDHDDYPQVMNALAWYCIEELARDVENVGYE